MYPDMWGGGGNTCSKEPIISVVCVARLTTGLTIRDGVDMRKMEGYCPLGRAGTRPTSRVEGTYGEGGREGEGGGREGGREREGEGGRGREGEGRREKERGSCSIGEWLPPSPHLLLAQCLQSPQLQCQQGCILHIHLPHYPTIK